VIEHHVDIDRLALDGRSSANTPYDRPASRCDRASSQISRVKVRSVVVGRLFEQLRRAADAGQRVLISCPAWRRARSPNAPRCDGSTAGPSCRRWCALAASPPRNPAAPQAAPRTSRPAGRRIARRAEIDLVFVDRGAARAHRSTSVSKGLPNGTRSRSKCRRKMRHRDFEKASAAALASR